MNEPIPEARRQCTAKAKTTGSRCRRAPIQGGTVCRMHGGAAPQVKAKADERLRALQDPALNRLEDLLNSATRVVVETKDGPVSIPIMKMSPGVILGAAKTVLDRTGLAETTKVEHSGEIITVDAIDSEIRRLEAEIAEHARKA